MQVFILALCYTIFNFMKKESISPDDVSERLDIVAARLFGLTRSQAQKAIHAAAIRVNHKEATPNHKLRADDIVTYAETPAEDGMLIPENIPLSMLYRDDHLIVVDKPAGLVVYPAAGHRQGTLMNALAHHCGKLSSVGGPFRPGVVHRLDKDTSGVMVVALDDSAYYHLVEQFRERAIIRRYQAIVYGGLKGESGEIDLEIGRSAGNRKKMSTRTQSGKEAVTRWRVLERFPEATLVEAKLGTGRTHQIRVHFSAIGHPLLGDALYGRKTTLERSGRKIVFPRQMLHAEVLGFAHPVTGGYLEFKSPLPEDMMRALEGLRAR